MLHFLKVNLRAFEGEVPGDVYQNNLNIHTTGTANLSPEMKTYYDTALIHAAEPKLVHAQFGQKRNIPQGRGKTIEFRKFSQLPKALTPLTEGVTPDGGSMKVTSDTATVNQYGYYIAISDILELSAIDPMLQEAVTALGGQAGRTLDTVIREILNAGTNVQYAEGQVTSRAALTSSHKLTVKAIKMAVRTLKNANADTIEGDFIGIIHPDIAFDLTNDPEWKYPHQYTDTKEIYEGEIGKIAGVRFVETTEAKIFEKAGAAIGEGASASKQSVYSTLILGANAYGVTEIEGGGLRTIIKQKGSAGTADPLDQRSTAGWKAILTAKILSDEYMVRVETGSTFSGSAN